MTPGSAHSSRVADPVGVLAVLQHRAQRGGGAVDVEVAGADELQGARPVERLGDAGRLEQVGLAQPAGGGGDLGGQPLGEPRAAARAGSRSRGRSPGGRASGRGSGA